MTTSVELPIQLVDELDCTKNMQQVVKFWRVNLFCPLSDSFIFIVLRFEQKSLLRTDVFFFSKVFHATK